MWKTVLIVVRFVPILIKMSAIDAMVQAGQAALGHLNPRQRDYPMFPDAIPLPPRILDDNKKIIDDPNVVLYLFHQYYMTIFNPKDEINEVYQAMFRLIDRNTGIPDTRDKFLYFVFQVYLFILLKQWDQDETHLEVLFRQLSQIPFEPQAYRVEFRYRKYNYFRVFEANQFWTDLRNGIGYEVDAVPIRHNTSVQTKIDRFYGWMEAHQLPLPQQLPNVRTNNKQRRKRNMRGPNRYYGARGQNQIRLSIRMTKQQIATMNNNSVQSKELMCGLAAEDTGFILWQNKLVQAKCIDPKCDFVTSIYPYCAYHARRHGLQLGLDTEIIIDGQQQRGRLTLYTTRTFDIGEIVAHYDPFVTDYMETLPPYCLYYPPTHLNFLLFRHYPECVLDNTFHRSYAILAKPTIHPREVNCRVDFGDPGQNRMVLRATRRILPNTPCYVLDSTPGNLYTQLYTQARFYTVFANAPEMQNLLSDWNDATTALRAFETYFLANHIPFQIDDGIVNVIQQLANPPAAPQNQPPPVPQIQAPPAPPPPIPQIQVPPPVQPPPLDQTPLPRRTHNRRRVRVPRVLTSTTGQTLPQTVLGMTITDTAEV